MRRRGLVVIENSADTTTEGPVVMYITKNKIKIITKNILWL